TGSMEEAGSLGGRPLFHTRPGQPPGFAPMSVSPERPSTSLAVPYPQPLLLLEPLFDRVVQRTVVGDELVVRRDLGHRVVGISRPGGSAAEVHAVIDRQVGPAVDGGVPDFRLHPMLDVAVAPDVGLAARTKPHRTHS